MHTIDFSRNKLIEMHYAVFAVWEREYSELIKEVFSSCKVKNYLDLGANTGIVAEYCNRFFDEDVRIIAFEPAEKNFEMLEEKIKSIKKFKNSRLYNKAIFYGAKKAIAYGVGDNSTAGLFLEGTLKDVNPHDHRKPIMTSHVFECTTLEEELGDVDSVELCKIDVEGSEYNILENSSFIQEKVDNILLEYHWKNETQTIEWLRKNFPSHEVIKSVYETLWLRKKIV